MLVYGMCECFVMQMLYFCVLCASVAVLNAALCMTWLQFLLMLREDGRDIMQSQSHDCLVFMCIRSSNTSNRAED